MNERNKLIKELQLLNHRGYLSGAGHLQLIADFILEDRKRICQPLIEFKNGFSPLLWLSREKDEYCGTDVFCNAIDKTLKLASLDKCST